MLIKLRSQEQKYHSKDDKFLRFLKSLILTILKEKFHKELKTVYDILWIR